MMWSTLLFLICAQKASASLSASVGPLTSYASKAATKVCNIVDYGAFQNGSDISSALSSAWSDCAVGGLVYIPPGNWSLASFPLLKNGVSSAVQLDGIIHRTGSDGSNMLAFRNCEDFEFFSGNSKGAIQGNGHEYLADGNYGPRLARFKEMRHFSIHGIALIESPSYYLTLDTVTNGEIYNIIMRGATVLGATDAIDVWGENVWIHDIEATNGDECVTVKSPASSFLIESIYCNLSGGNAIGSLSTGTNISDITYRHIYANWADPCYIKSNGGNGTVQNILWDTVTMRDAAYPLAINSGWQSEDGGGDGVFFKNLTFKNWHGYNEKNSRSTIRLECPDEVPCTDITLDNVNLWSANDATYAVNNCFNAYGTGSCLRNETDSMSTYSSYLTLTATPSHSTTWMPNDFTTELFANSTFTIPPIPTTFYPGQKPSSALLSLTGPGVGPASASSSSIVASSSTPVAKTSTSVTIVNSDVQTTGTSLDSAATFTSSLSTNQNPKHNHGHNQHVGNHIKKAGRHAGH